MDLVRIVVAELVDDFLYSIMVLISETFSDESLELQGPALAFIV